MFRWWRQGISFRQGFGAVFGVQLCFACFEGLEARPTDTPTDTYRYPVCKVWGSGDHAQVGKLQKRFWLQLKVHCLPFTSFGGPKRVLTTIPCFEFQSFTPRVYFFMDAYSQSSEEERGAKPYISYMHFSEHVQISWCHNVNCMVLLRCWCCKPKSFITDRGPPTFGDGIFPKQIIPSVTHVVIIEPLNVIGCFALFVFLCFSLQIPIWYPVHPIPKRWRSASTRKYKRWDVRLGIG